MPGLSVNLHHPNSAVAELGGGCCTLKLGDEAGNVVTVFTTPGRAEAIAFAFAHPKLVIALATELLLQTTPEAAA